MRDPLRAGIAIYNDGYYHAAHDAWEARWLECESGTPDERLLHGLIQFTAAIYHAHNGNWEGATGLAESAGDYLAGLPTEYRDVALEPVRTLLETLASDPEVVERRPPLPLEHEGTMPGLADLSLAATTIAAPILAEDLGFDEEPIERAIEYAKTDLEAGRDDSRFVSLVVDFVREADHRGIVYQRLTGHVERRTAKERDVEGLF
ncbi:DUF309 domain-containing protein [Halobacteria archaeon AArc-m2/3/4]|uniref:DUF309 domain-containing protein n=1 Tax=Natronoglomus mannanivorans TaxID=2979990 RepID=A0AAP2YYE9_9EURY|nr:DUF309 domain-containing protein [Halobacteria archaeon AArc-xg1-1]MCU4973589.1 DUF309 domain-containing protein [Halobacteria archaeon AArc-m2/3/4]